MSKKRVTLKEKNPSRGNQEAKVYQNKYTCRGVEYFNFMVKGWQVDGKWQRKQFPDRDKAEAFADGVPDRGSTPLASTFLLRKKNVRRSLGAKGRAIKLGRVIFRGSQCPSVPRSVSLGAFW